MLNRIVVVLVLCLIGCDRGANAPAKQEPAKQEPAQQEPAQQRPPQIQLPQIMGSAPPLDTFSGPTLTATPTAIVIDDKQVLALTNGEVDPAEKKPGTLVDEITRLPSALGAAPPGATLRLAVDRSLSYKLLVEIMASAKQKEAGWTSFALVATSGASKVGLPLTIPSKAPPQAAAVAPLPPERSPIDARLEHVGVAPKSSVPPDALTHKIQSAYLAGIRRCYKQALTKDPSLRGKVTLTFTVNRTGRTTESTAKGFDASVDSCIAGQMKSWVFAIPKDEAGEPAEVSFQLSLQLVADTNTPPPAPSDIDDQLSAAARPTLPPEDIGLGLIVSVTKDDIVLWSSSGLEGTLAQPRLRVTRSDPAAMTKLGDQLRDITHRRWQGKQRPQDSHSIILQADPATTIQTIAELIAAVRASPDGKEPLFPDIQLAVGFQ